MEELVNVGVPLSFVTDLTVYRRRWYWLDETIVERSLDSRLFYHALTRQYRVSVAGQVRSFGTFEEAMRAVLSVRNWTVLEKSRLTSGESYNVALRLRLNTAELPKPFQVAAL